ncbi:MULTISPECIES: PP2C family protein-serine/threonine phosphatase [Streptomyces]|uniref:PP2C family protein-serine/threonine phosphatase n=1 Tax=Streptomyces TaxID=1883 RepID=UPI002248F63A|nr:SpoIIE family protein phosphatase [Streptomyces sp. JHD 1]MCX2968838.1 SpoIIE family protein phosphatase [Streptomyces sp. JHD 1]
MASAVGVPGPDDLAADVPGSTAATGEVSGTADADPAGARTPRPRRTAETAVPEVLLVEDDDGDALLVEELLLDSGVTVELTRARSLADAKAALAEAPAPHCVLLDLHLPDGQGVDVVQQMLGLAPRAAVVVLTGLAEEDAGLAAVSAGAQDYLVKGLFEPALLGRAIRYAIQRRQIEQATAALQASQLRAQENRRLERGLLPSPLLRSRVVDVVAQYEPGREQALLGGDFYDVVATEDGTVHAVIGDVSGHGPDEAALGVCLRVAWRSFTLAGESGPAALRLMQELLVAERTRPEIFATVTTVELAPARGTARVIRAGHPPLFLRDAARPAVGLLDPATGPALGLLPEGLARWPEEEVALPSAGALVLFTDGLFEGRCGERGERLGEDGLLELARGHADRSGADFVPALIAQTRSLSERHGGHSDDVAVVHLAWEQSR